ncbi:MAG: hypothetical protein ABW122_14295 [Ilumatobacteraceae bacterium]
MRATRLRLRFVTGVSVPAATYGSGTYGSQTYGQSATDPLSSYRYRIVPLPAGRPTVPSWIYRQSDTWADFEALILADAGPLDLTAVGAATLVLDPIDGRDPGTDALGFPLTVASPATTGVVGRSWQPGDLAGAGTYRATIVLTFLSGRQLTLPGDDATRFVVNAGYVAP